MHEIAKATLKDTKDLSQLLSLLMAQEADFAPDEKAQERGITSIINAPDIGLILKLEIEGKITGMINILFSISTSLGGKVAIFEDFIVAPNYRHKGYGKLLFQEAILQAKEQGCLRITLLTDMDNAAAQHFYQGQGMQCSAMVPFRMVF